METKGKTVLVTGSSRGIGRGIALELARGGAAKVCITYLGNKEAAEKTLAAVREAGSDGIAVQCDVCQPASIEALFGRVKDEFGHLDILVSNARGELSEFYQPADAISLEQFEHAFQSQSRAFHLCVKQARDIMPDGGRIVAITYAPSARHRQLATVGGHGRGQGCAGIAVPLLRRAPGIARHHGQHREPRRY